MPVPKRSNPLSGPCSRIHRSLALSLLLLLSAAPLFAKGADVPLRIPLEPLGFQAISAQFLAAGSALFTVHYVDDRHLLFTFTVRRLLTRMPDCPEDDQDRNVDALLLELPTGRILARTSWRLHDHGQYLWDLGHGHFMLRVRDKLTTFAPLINLATGHPFSERPLLATSERRIGAILQSPAANLLIVETLPLTPSLPRSKAPLFGPTPPPLVVLSDPLRVQINFYRLSIPKEAGDEIKLQAAGAVRSNNTGNIASTSAGYLSIIDQGNHSWAFDFNSYTGKTSELSPFDSTCRPSPVFVSRSEFIAFGCRGGNSRQLLGGFNMRGEEMWEQNLFSNYIAPSLVFSPSAGRFALSRILMRSPAVPDQPLNAVDLSSQSVIVYQADSGKQILHAECTPIERAGQNFSLSPNGLGLAVIHADAIEIYTLPPLTAKENADVKLADASAPEENEAPIRFANAHASSPGTVAADTYPVANTPATPEETSETTSAQPEPAQPDASPTGDPQPEQHRKAPTLYTLPTDSPQSPTSNDPQ